MIGIGGGGWFRFGWVGGGERVDGVLRGWYGGGMGGWVLLVVWLVFCGSLLDFWVSRFTSGCM